MEIEGRGESGVLINAIDVLFFFFFFKRIHFEDYWSFLRVEVDKKGKSVSLYIYKTSQSFYRDNRYWNGFLNIEVIGKEGVIPRTLLTFILFSFSDNRLKDEYWNSFLRELGLFAKTFTIFNYLF
jgi:hypothetical protein